MVLCKIMFVSLPDINECEAGTDRCDVTTPTKCINTAGGYKCECAEDGLELDSFGYKCVGKLCMIINARKYF